MGNHFIYIFHDLHRNENIHVQQASGQQFWKWHTYLVDVMLCVQVGSDHLSVDIDSVVSGMTTLFGVITGKKPHFRVRHQHICCNTPISLDLEMPISI